MADRDDVPYIVIERGGSGIGPFIVGALLGAGVALLFAPRSGEETQQEIRRKAAQLRGAAEEKVRSVQQQIEQRFEQAREGVMGRVDHLREAVDSGRAAAQEARTDLEGRIDRTKAAYRAGVDAAREELERDSPEERI
jgi:gas vesicle protein